MRPCAFQDVLAVEARSRHAFPRHTHDRYGIGLIVRGAQRSWSGRGTVTPTQGLYPIRIIDMSVTGTSRVPNCGTAAENCVAQAGPVGYTCTIYCTNPEIQESPSMRVISFSDARNSLKKVIDQVVDDADVAVISRRDAPDAVLMSLDTFNSWMETVHLLKTPANAAHLEKSIQQLRKGRTKPRSLIAP
jgi:antitoxin YefM